MLVGPLIRPLPREDSVISLYVGFCHLSQVNNRSRLYFVFLGAPHLGRTRADRPRRRDLGPFAAGAWAVLRRGLVAGVGPGEPSEPRRSPRRLCLVRRLVRRTFLVHPLPRPAPNLLKGVCAR